MVPEDPRNESHKLPEQEPPARPLPAFWGSLSLSGAMRTSLGLDMGLWGSLDLSGALWESLGLSGALWSSLGLSGALWGSLGPSGPLWTSQGLSDWSDSGYSVGGD